MLYLVKVRAAMETANTIDAGKGPGPVFAKVAERFRPEAFYGNPTRLHTSALSIGTGAMINESQRAH